MPPSLTKRELVGMCEARAHVLVLAEPSRAEPSRAEPSRAEPSLESPASAKACKKARRDRSERGALAHCRTVAFRRGDSASSQSATVQSACVQSSCGVGSVRARACVRALAGDGVGWDGREMAAKAAERKAPPPLKESLSFNLKKASVLVSNPAGTP